MVKVAAGVRQRAKQFAIQSDIIFKVHEVSYTRQFLSIVNNVGDLKKKKERRLRDLQVCATR